MQLYYDLHIHSCLSPCGSNASTPSAIVKTAAKNGLDVIAIADHNSCLNVAAAVKVGLEHDVLVVPAVEMTTSENIHVLCYFEEVRNAVAFSDILFANMPHMLNIVEKYGKQLVVDENDKVVGVSDHLRTVATTISIFDVQKLVTSFGGIAVPAHIYNSYFGILPILKGMDKNLKFKTVELTAADALREEVNLKRKYTNSYIDGNVNVIVNSDAHMLNFISKRKYCIETKTKTVENLLYQLS